MNKFSKIIETKFLALGIYQVAGGIIGIGLLSWLLTKQNNLRFLIGLLLLSAFMLFAYSIYCGVLLLKKKESGLKHSLINQCLQVFGFAMYGYAFTYVSGIYFTIGIDLTESFELKFGLGISTWQLNININNQLFYAHINFVALFLLIFISRLQKTIREEEFKKQLSELGKE